jgi:hypothetical protein
MILMRPRGAVSAVQALWARYPEYSNDGGTRQPPLIRQPCDGFSSGGIRICGPGKPLPSTNVAQVISDTSATIATEITFRD